MTESEKQSLEAIANDVADGTKDVKAALAAYKAGGMQAVLAQLPHIVGDVQRDVADVHAALPVIKPGFRTSEFWLVVLAILANAVYPALTGKALPVDANAVIGSVVGIYTVVRGIIKGQAAPAPAAK